MKHLLRLAFGGAGLALLGLGCGAAPAPDIAVCSAPPEVVRDAGGSFQRCREGTGVASLRLRFSPTQGTEALFATEIGNIRCRRAKGEARLAQQADGLEGSVGKLAFGQCGENIPNCSTVEELKVDVPVEPVRVSYLGHRAPQARIVLLGARASARLRCAFVGEIRCAYGGGEALAGMIGNPPSQQLRFDAPLALAGGASLCAKEAFVRMIADIEADDLVLDDGTRLKEGLVWVAREK